MNTKYIFTTILFVLISIQSIFAVPTYPCPIEYKQPDGSIVTITLKGDEFVSWAISTDGFTLLSDENGFFEYAVKNSAGDLVLSGVRARNENQRTTEEKLLLQNYYCRRFENQRLGNNRFIWQKNVQSSISKFSFDFSS